MFKCCCTKGDIENEEKIEVEFHVGRPRCESSMHVNADLVTVKSAVPTYASFKESILEPIPEMP